MKIQNDRSNLNPALPKAAAERVEKEKESNQPADAVDKFIPSEQENSRPVQGFGYSQYDAAAVERLKAGVNQAYDNLRNLVLRLLQRQGQATDDCGTLPDILQLDNEARAEAAAAIAPDGPLSAEAVSDDIVEFAKAISGGDKSKLEMLKGAIEKGFSEAAGLLGGKLPDVSLKTKELVWQKLDAWAKGE